MTAPKSRTEPATPRGSSDGADEVGHLVQECLSGRHALPAPTRARGGQGTSLERPSDCPPEAWEKVAASALAYLADPAAPRRPCTTVEEALWQGRADAMARRLRMPAHRINQMVMLHRPYLLPGVEQDPAA